MLDITQAFVVDPFAQREAPPASIAPLLLQFFEDPGALSLL